MNEDKAIDLCDKNIQAGNTIDEETAEAYHHGVRSRICSLSAELYLLKDHKRALLHLRDNLLAGNVEVKECRKDDALTILNRTIKAMEGEWDDKINTPCHTCPDTDKTPLCTNTCEKRIEYERARAVRKFEFWWKTQSPEIKLKFLYDLRMQKAMPSSVSKMVSEKIMEGI